MQPKQIRGFALLNPERRREIAALGGKAQKPEDRSFARDPSLAARAGAVGGAKSRRGRKPAPSSGTPANS